MKVAARYGGFRPDSPMIKWFWDILLNEWDDEQRRNLLVFATGSDRAPVNGLKAMRFEIHRDDSNDATKLPTSSTCYNALKLPEYPNQATLKQKLDLAISDPTGFGVV